MTAYEQTFGQESGSILRNLRKGLFRLMRGAARPDLAELDDPDAEQLYFISQVLLNHGLEISPYTLGVAYDYVTGGDPQLARQIDAEVALGQEISLEWLEEKGADRSDEAGIAKLSEVIQRLERNLASFGASAQAARSAMSKIWSGWWV